MNQTIKSKNSEKVKEQLLKEEDNETEGHQQENT